MRTPAGVDSAPAIPSSRILQRHAGWRCARRGSYRMLLPHRERPFSWLNPLPLWRSRNDKLARWFGDPTNDLRRAWIDRLGGPDQDFTVRDFADQNEVSAILLGDTGEGDGSQYAVVPGLLKEGMGSDFMFIISDLIYPAGGIDDYLDKFYRPYKDYRGPIYGVPGNHDWYDDLTGFIFHLAGRNEPAPRVTGPGSGWKRFLRQLLWRHAPKGKTKAIEAMQRLRPAPAQRKHQPGPYLAIEAGPLLLVGIDTGITGGIDRDQGEWLRRISRATPKPKILLTGKPLYVDGKRHPGAIEGGGTVDDIVTAPEHNYIAAIGGDVHNYQRYPVRLDGGRTLQYIVSGGGGAFMNETHRIPNIDHSGLRGITESDFRCYPLRGDSLSLFSRNYGRLFSLGHLGQWLGFGRLLLRFWFIEPDEAAAIMAKRLGLSATRPSARDVLISRRAQLVASWISPLWGSVHGLLQPYYSELLDWNDPPMFKNFLHLEASSDTVSITCFAATGCLEHENNPPIEDCVRATRTDDGRWTWADVEFADE
jgi:hypothetical protein